MKTEENKITPQALFNKISDYFEIINQNSELKHSFVEFDKYYKAFTNNKGFQNALKQKKQSQSINQNKKTIDTQDTEIKGNEDSLNALKEKIGTKETEDKEATGLYKDIFNLTEEKEQLNNDLTKLKKIENEHQQNKDTLANEINKLTKEKTKLEEEIGTKETEDNEATGLYKEIFDLTEKIGYPATEDEATGLYKDHDDKREKLEKKYKEKEVQLIQDYNHTQDGLSKKIKELEKKIKEKNDEVANVKDLSELKKENKSHIKLHFVVSTIVSIALLIIICYVIFGVFGNIEKYINFANKELTSLDMLSSAFSFLLIKIPFAIVFGIILGGGYSVLRSCVNHYENIHKEIRDISSIYAITGRMSIESILILGKIKEFSTEEDEDKLTDFLTISDKDDRDHLKEKLKWHEIAKYLASRGKSNITKSQELKTSATSVPNNLIPLLSQVTKMIKALK